MCVVMGWYTSASGHSFGIVHQVKVHPQVESEDPAGGLWDPSTMGCAHDGMQARWGAGRMGCGQDGVRPRWDARKLGCRQVGIRAGWDAGTMGCGQDGVRLRWDARKLGCRSLTQLKLDECSDCHVLLCAHSNQPAAPKHQQPAAQLQVRIERCRQRAEERVGDTF